MDVACCSEQNEEFVGESVGLELSARMNKTDNSKQEISKILYTSDLYLHLDGGRSLNNI